MLKFWRFTKNEIQDTTPDFYFSAEEEDWFNEFNDFEKYLKLTGKNHTEERDKANKFLEEGQAAYEKDDFEVLYLSLIFLLKL